MSSLITVEAIGVGIEGYNAYQSGKNASNARSLANSTAAKQDYYNNLLMNLMSNPDTFFNTQVFQSAQDQGLKAAERKMNSMGYKDSGNILSALQQQGEGFAFSALQNQEQILAGISGVNKASSPSDLLDSATGAQKQASSDSGTFISDLNYLAKMYSGGPGQSTVGPGSGGGGSSGPLSRGFI